MNIFFHASLFAFYVLATATVTTLAIGPAAPQERNTEIGKALITLRPGEAWSLAGDDCKNLRWHAKTKPPTCAEIDTEIARQRKAPPPTRNQQVLEKLKALGLTPDDLKELMK